LWEATNKRRLAPAFPSSSPRRSVEWAAENLFWGVPIFNFTFFKIPKGQKAQFLGASLAVSGAVEIEISTALFF